MTEKEKKNRENALLYLEKKKEKRLLEKETTETTTLQPSIFDKYRHYIEQVKADYLRGMSYAEAMEIHRYCEKALGRTMGLDTSCGRCMIDRVKMFASLEK